jgi:hypothetical protein
VPELEIPTKQGHRCGLPACNTRDGVASAFASSPLVQVVKKVGPGSDERRVGGKNKEPPTVERWVFGVAQQKANEHYAGGMTAVHACISNMASLFRLSKSALEILWVEHEAIVLPTRATPLSPLLVSPPPPQRSPCAA